jgi:hypothetical protein
LLLILLILLLFILKEKLKKFKDKDILSYLKLFKVTNL